MGKKINDNTITKRTSPDGNDQLPLGAPGDSTDYVLLLSKLKEYVMEDVAEALDGEDLTVNSIAKTGFVSGTGGNGWKLYANGNGEVQDLYVRGNETVKGYVSSENFVSGAAGAGWKLNNDGTAEFESLYIRGAFSATEFRVRKITSQGGNLAITDAARISNVIEESDHYHCLIDTENGTIAVQLEVDDLVRCQIWDGPTAKYYTGIVVDKGAGWFDIEKPLLDGAGVPAAGDTVFRWGNVSTANRQGLIYLSSNDSSAPYMDVYDGIDGVSYSGKLKARLGKLSGITSPAHGALTGYGLYANRAYLENAYISGAITVGAGSNVYTQAETDNKVNNKSKNFTATPTNYQTGDTWTLQSDTVVNGVQYKAGDLLTASAASASYNQAHWTKWVRYTDDTELNKIKTAKIRYIRDWSRHVRDVDEDHRYYSIKAKRNDVDYAQGISVANLTSNTGYGVITGANIVDGNDATFGHLNHGLSYYGYIQLDLGELREIDVIEILKYTAETQDGKKTEVSADGINWTTVYDPVSDGGSVLGKTTIKMAGVNALMSLNKSIPETAGAYSSVASIRDNNFRYVRVMCLGEINNYPNNIRELEVYSGGVNVALGKPVTALSMSNQNNAMVTDGDVGPDAMFYDYDWVNVDLQSSFAIDTIRVLRRTYDSQQYKNRVECSKDNITWYSIADDRALGRWVGGDTYYSVKSPGQQSAEQKTRLDEWANDGSISPAEKTALKELQAQITKDKDDLITRATALTVSVTNFTAAWGSFNTDLTNLTAASPESINILITAPSFDINRTNYYTERNNLEKAIQDALNVKATEAQTAANSKAKLFTTNPPSGYNAGDLWIPQSDYSDTGTTFKKDNLYRATTTSASFSKTHWVIATNYTDDTVANSKTTTFTGATAPTPNKVGDLWFDTTNKKWKTWNGSTWDVREDKVVGYIKDALDENTEIVGGLTLGTVMAVKKSSVVKAYMSAVGDYAFAAGVTNFADVGETRAFAVKHNGDIEVKYGGADRLKFVASTGALTISGTVNASAGMIGGYTIESNYLQSGTKSWGNDAMILDAAANSIKLYSGTISSDNTGSGTLLPDIEIKTYADSGAFGSVSVGAAIFQGALIDANRDVTRVSGHGIISNSSNTPFIPSASGIDSNGSIVALLRRGNSGYGYSGFYSRGISAAIVGLSQVTQGDYNSRTYGGYFNSLFTGTFHTGVKEISSSSTFYFAGEFITTIYCASGASGAWLMFPSINHEEGRVLIIRNSSGGSVNISRTSSENLYLGDNSSVTTTSIGNKRTQIWQRLGDAWRLLIDQAF